MVEENHNEDVWRLTNTILNDSQVSFKAKGIFLYLVSSNENRGLTFDMIKKKSAVDSERSIKMGINELEKHGYIIRNSLKNEEVRWTYNLKRNISEEKRAQAKSPDVKQHLQTKKPQTKKPQTKKSPRKKETRRRAKKSGFNHALGNFFKEFF